MFLGSEFSKGTVIEEYSTLTKIKQMNLREMSSSSAVSRSVMTIMSRNFCQFDNDLTGLDPCHDLLSESQLVIVNTFNS